MEPSSADSPSRRLEVILAFMLSLAAVVTAWCSFQSSQLTGTAQRNYSEGIRVADEASQTYNSAVSGDIQDRALFLEFAKAANTGDEATTAYLLDTLMSPELAAAVTWWADQPDSAGYDSPFVPENPQWSTVEFDAAAELDAEALALFDVANSAGETGARFDLLTVLVSLALFLFGIASLVRRTPIAIGLASLGGVLLLISLVRALFLGDPAGVL